MNSALSNPSSLSIGSVVGLIVGSTLLKGDNQLLNTLIGIAIGTILEQVIQRLRAIIVNSKWFHLFTSIPPPYKYAIVYHQNDPGSESNYALSKYVLETFGTYIVGQRLTYISKEMSTNYSLESAQLLKPMWSVFEGHRILITVNNSRCKRIFSSEGTSASVSKDDSLNAPIFIFQSNTADPKVLHRFVYEIYRKATDTCDDIVVNQVYIKERNGEESASWNVSRCPATKKIENTQVHYEVHKNFYDDIGKFMETKGFYKDCGLVHQRGYFLHSNPGQGKTAMIKAVAERYRLSLYTVDFSIVKTSQHFSSLMTDIANCSSAYILAFEDIDRCESILEASGAESSISMTTLLNALDGLCEPRTRIIIMTANDPSMLERHKALVRPGRIDQVICIPFVNVDQLQRMFGVFYKDFDCKKPFALRSKISAADLMCKIFGTCDDEEEDDNPGSSSSFSLDVLPNLVSTRVISVVQRIQNNPLEALRHLTCVVKG